MNCPTPPGWDTLFRLSNDELLARNQAWLNPYPHRAVAKSRVEIEIERRGGLSEAELPYLKRQHTLCAND